MKYEIRTHFQSWKVWNTMNYFNSLVKVFDSYKDMFSSPIRFGPTERKTFDLTDLTSAQKEKWYLQSKGGFFRIKKPWGFDVKIFFIPTPKRKIPSSFWIFCSADYLNEKSWVEKFLSLHEDIYRWGEMDHGSISLWKEFEDKNLVLTESAGGGDISKTLPGIYWINYFGPSYISKIGQKKFETLDCFYKKKLWDGGYLIQSRENIFDYYGEGNSILENNIINHLGRKIFFGKQ